MNPEIKVIDIHKTKSEKIKKYNVNKIISELMCNTKSMNMSYYKIIMIKNA